jgi:hypothetical protein
MNTIEASGLRLVTLIEPKQKTSKSSDRGQPSEIHLRSELANNLEKIKRMEMETENLRKENMRIRRRLRDLRWQTLRKKFK